MSTADFTETFESLVKKIETRLHAPFKELNARKKTYADILVSFYLTDVNTHQCSFISHNYQGNARPNGGKGESTLPRVSKHL